MHHVRWSGYFRLSNESARRMIGETIEGLQLSTKNEVQKRFLLAQRSEYEARGRSA